MNAMTFDEIRAAISTEIEKFNPNHDSMGRFSTSERSVLYTIRTKDPSKQHWADSAMARDRARDKASKEKKDGIEPKADPKKTEQKPKATAKPKAVSNPKNGKDASNEKDTSKGYVAGKDIVSSVDFSPKKYEGTNVSKSLTDRIAEQQGYKGQPTVVSKEEFDRAAQESGIIAYRTMANGKDVISGKKTSGRDFAGKLMHGDENQFALNGNGAQAMGGGVYFATNPKDKVNPGTMPDGKSAKHHSVSWYGGKGAVVVTATLSPNAKIADHDKLQSELRNLPKNVASKFNFDVGAYAAAKGYDAVRGEFDNGRYDYLTVVNRTALIISDAVQNA